MADGAVVEAGPLRESRRFAELLATSHGAGRPPGRRGGAGAGRRAVGRRWPTTAGRSAPTRRSSGADALVDRAAAQSTRRRCRRPRRCATMREIVRLVDQRPPLRPARASGCSIVVIVLGLDGSVLPWLWADAGRRRGPRALAGGGHRGRAARGVPILYYTEQVVPRVVGPADAADQPAAGARADRAAPGQRAHPGRGGRPGRRHRAGGLPRRQPDRPVHRARRADRDDARSADRSCPACSSSARWWCPGWRRRCSGPGWRRSARRTVAARAAFATALVSSLSAARTVKLAGATGPVLRPPGPARHRAQRAAAAGDRDAGVGALDPVDRPAACCRSRRGRCTWAATCSAGAALVAVSTLGAARWFAWTTASLVSQMPSARVWTRRTVAMTGIADYSARRARRGPVGRHRARAADRAPQPAAASWSCSRFSAVHEDGTVGVRDVDLTVDRGQLVLVVGPVGSGKSSLLRALAGIVHHTGDAALERPAGRRAGGVPAAQPGRLRGAAAAGAVRDGRRQHPARPRAGRGRRRAGRAARARPGRGRRRARRC